MTTFAAIRKVESVTLTEHAVSRFRERAGRLDQDPMGEERAKAAIRKYLARAREEQIDTATRTKRLIANRFKPVEYWTAEGWRFVVSMERGAPVLVTCERTKPWQN